MTLPTFRQSLPGHLSRIRDLALRIRPRSHSAAHLQEADNLLIRCEAAMKEIVESFENHGEMPLEWELRRKLRLNGPRLPRFPRAPKG